MICLSLGVLATAVHESTFACWAFVYVSEEAAQYFWLTLLCASIKAWAELIAEVDAAAGMIGTCAILLILFTEADIAYIAYIAAYPAPYAAPA